MDTMIEDLYDQTYMTIQQIADELGLSFGYVFQYIKDNYDVETRNERKRECYRRSKLGDKNPMLGKKREAHHNYKGVVSDGKGYLMVLKPNWYTGRKGCKHVFLHHVVMCEALGLTEIPRGMCVHHIDHNPLNNDLSNLQMLSVSAHNRLHQLERATTIRKE